MAPVDFGKPHYLSQGFNPIQPVVVSESDFWKHQLTEATTEPCGILSEEPQHLGMRCMLMLAMRMGLGSW